VPALLHERFPEVREALRCVALGERPTPVRELPALSDGVWLKDDGTFGGGGWGGNKVRKLEWILAEARRRGARTILTVGGLGTNWGLAAALYGREHGFRVALALLDQPIDDHVDAQLTRLRRSGAALHFTHSKARTIAALPWLVLRYSHGVHPPYVLPAGGSSPVGALGYVEGALELAAQVHEGALPEPSHVVTAVGSGGTVAGLALGLRLAGLRTRVVGVVVNDALRLDAQAILRLVHRTERLLRDRGAALPSLKLGEDDLTLVRDWLGPGYGHHTPEADRAQELAGERESLALEPVYTAKAMAALLAMNAAGRFGDGPILFLQTHGPR
jgi:D-cysteine desulfhydrase